MENTWGISSALLNRGSVILTTYVNLGIAWLSPGRTFPIPLKKDIPSINFVSQHDISNTNYVVQITINIKQWFTMYLMSNEDQMAI